MARNCGKGTLLHHLHDLPGQAGGTQSFHHWWHSRMPQMWQHGADRAAGGLATRRRRRRKHGPRGTSHCTSAASTIASFPGTVVPTPEWTAIASRGGTSAASGCRRLEPEHARRDRCRRGNCRRGNCRRGNGRRGNDRCDRRSDSAGRTVLAEVDSRGNRSAGRAGGCRGHLVARRPCPQDRAVASGQAAGHARGRRAARYAQRGRAARAGEIRPALAARRNDTAAEPAGVAMGQSAGRGQVDRPVRRRLATDRSRCCRVWVCGSTACDGSRWPPPIWPSGPSGA